MAGHDLLRMFEALLLLSGYDDDDADNYRRTLKLLDARAFIVGEDFPCLRRASLPPQVRKVSYTLDLDGLEQSALPIDDAILSLGLT